MSLFKLMGLISTIALFVPIFFLLFTKLVTYRTFPAIFVYLLVVLLFNTFSLGYISINKQFTVYFGITANLLDAPFMLIFLAYFGRTPRIRKAIFVVLSAFIAFEIITLSICGYNRQTSIIIIGPGLLLVLILSLLFFIHQVKISVIYHKAPGKALITAALLFAYTGYMYVYVVFYLLSTNYKRDAYLVYFLIIIFSSITLGIGIALERKRVKQIMELKITRKELRSIYREEEKKAIPPLENIALNFDNKQWN